MMLRTSVLGCLLACLVAACSSDGSSCGSPPAGGTCKKPGGDCEALVCQGSSWVCPAGDTRVALTADSCVAGDGGSGGDAGCSGSAPSGGTCRKPGGDCEGLVCQGSSWVCPVGDTQIALTADSCNADAGPGDSGHD